MTRARGRDPADALAGLLFLAIPVLASPWFWDQFTTVKWYALEALAALWLLAERFWGGGWRWPAWVGGGQVPLLLLAVLAVINLARGGWGWSLTPLVERATVLALAFCAFRYARRRRSPLRWPALGTGIAALVTNALGDRPDPGRAAAAGAHRGRRPLRALRQREHGRAVPGLGVRAAAAGAAAARPGALALGSAAGLDGSLPLLPLLPLGSDRRRRRPRVAAVDAPGLALVPGESGRGAGLLVVVLLGSGAAGQYRATPGGTRGWAPSSGSTCGGPRWRWPPTIRSAWGRPTSPTPSRPIT